MLILFVICSVKETNIKKFLLVLFLRRDVLWNKGIVICLKKCVKLSILHAILIALKY